MSDYRAVSTPAEFARDILKRVEDMALRIEVLERAVRGNVAMTDVQYDDQGRIIGAKLTSIGVVGDPVPEWRRLVDESRNGVTCDVPSGEALGFVLNRLSHIADPAFIEHNRWLADIVAVCEKRVDDGWKADPDRVPVGHWGISWLLVPLSHEPPDWTVVGHRSAAWLRSLTDGGAA